MSVTGGIIGFLIAVIVLLLWAGVRLQLEVDRLREKQKR